MIRFNSAENVLRGDVIALRDIARIIHSMEMEAAVLLEYDEPDTVLQASINVRVVFIKELARVLDGSTAKGCAEEVISIWGDTGASIDDYLNKDGSSETVIKLADKLEAGYYSEDYDGYGWDE